MNSYCFLIDTKKFTIDLKDLPIKKIGLNQYCFDSDNELVKKIPIEYVNEGRSIMDRTIKFKVNGKEIIYQKIYDGYYKI